MQRILYKIDKEWDTGIINIQEYADMVDLVHKDYYDILYKYTESEYLRARKIAERKVDRQITRMVTKSKKDVPIKINKIEEEKGLWGTIPETRTDIEHMTFVASDKTMQRVKADKITKILHKGYTEGLNGKEVGRHIRVGFSKLKGYEAERIARTELHSAHEKGLLDQYKDMNVKYKQWDAHIDSRTRDEHIHLNGEITTIDGTFSNGLKNPGDKNGPIKEWINCRCTSAPYLMPIGKQAPPGATHFREEDLIDANLHGFNIEEHTLEEAITGNWKLRNVEETANHYGLELTKKDTKYIFYDKKHDCTISIPKKYLSDNGKAEYLIDFNNAGKGEYDIQRVLEIYDNAHSIKKHATNRIIFNFENDNDDFAYSRFLSEYGRKVININPLTLKLNKYKRGNLQQSLYHEMEHCLDYSLMKQEIADLINEWVYFSKGHHYFKDDTPQKIKARILAEKYGISGSDEFKNIVEANREYQRDNWFLMEKSSSYSELYGDKEDLAEAGSMSDFHFLDGNERKHAVLENYNGEDVPFDVWVKHHQKMYEYVVKILSEIKPSDFTF